MMVNVNVCTTAFYKAGNLARAMKDFMGKDNARVGGFVTGLRVQTTHLGHRQKKTIKRVGEFSARQQSFICEEYGNASITVEQYFLRSAYSYLPGHSWGIGSACTEWKSLSSLQNTRSSSSTL